MLNRLPDLRSIPSLDLPCVVCGGAVLRWATAGGAPLASRCLRCGTVRFAPAAGAGKATAQTLDSYRDNRHAVREQVRANLDVVQALTRGRRLLEVGHAGAIASAMARAAGFAPHYLRLGLPGARRTGVSDAAFLAPLEQEVLSDRTYDAIYARGGLGRAPDPRAFLADLSLLLERRGILFVNAPAVEVAGNGGLAVARRQRNAFTRGGLAELVENAGFDIVCESAAMPGFIAYMARLQH